MQALCKTDISECRLDTSKMYQDLYYKANKIVKKDACMKFYDAARPLHLETDVGLRARLLQVRDGMNHKCDEVPDNMMLCPIASTSISPSSAEWHYSNIECRVLKIFYG